jgi:hypothetical protein
MMELRFEPRPYNRALIHCANKLYKYSCSYITNRKDLEENNVFYMLSTTQVQKSSLPFVSTIPFGMTVRNLGKVAMP